MIDRSPYSIAWTFILGKGVTREVQNMLQNHFSPSQSDHLDLPDLHKALMGLSDRNFDEALDLTSRFAIDAVDASRRTALSWAAERGNEYELSRLLMCGADPNIPDLNGMTPLHWGASVGEAQCVQALLLAKADIEARHRLGSTPLSLAGQSGSAETVKTLVTVEDNGLLAQSFVTWYDGPWMLQVLLDSRTGLMNSGPRHGAIRRIPSQNRYDLMAILINSSDLEAIAKWEEYYILYDVVDWADMDSVKVLLRHLKRPGRFDADDIHNSFRYPRICPVRYQTEEEVAAQLDGYKNAWYDAVKALVTRYLEVIGIGHNGRNHEVRVGEYNDTDSEDIWEEAQEKLP